MRKLTLGFVVVCMLSLLVIPIATADATYYDMTIDTQGRDLTLTHEDNIFIFYNIVDTKTPTNTETYLLLDGNLLSEGIVETDSLTPYIIEYENIVKITIQATDDGFDLTFEILFEELASTSTITLNYFVNGTPTALEFTENTDEVFMAELVIANIPETTETTGTIWDRIIEWFVELF